MHKRNYKTLDHIEHDYFTKHPEEIKSYLKVAMDEYQKDGNEKAFLAALSVAAKVHGGFSKLAKETGLNRENLYRALSDKRDPKFSTVMHVLTALGVTLKVA